MHPLLYISEQHQREKLDISDSLKAILQKPVYKKTFHRKADSLCFIIVNENQDFLVDTTYYVGADWVIPQQAAVYVEPKLNGERQVDFLRILLESLEAPENLEHLDGLFHVDYEEPWIVIPQQKDLLSPILIVQFLKLVQRIVRKGLKKSYYRITKNLNSRVKGKILVGLQVKENVVKNRLTKTICNYQEYGINTTENQFLKLVLTFVSSYLSRHQHFYTKDQSQQLLNILHYCLPSFEQVETMTDKHQSIYLKKNAFYREYEEALKIGGFILKRFSFNINKASQRQTSTPPFWIDMSKLFELYVFGKLKKIFPETNAITYHDTFLGRKETDILIRKEGYKCVIDCKYKPGYEHQNPSLEDKRQLAGYARLKSVYNKLNLPYNKTVRGVIIYSHLDCPEEINKRDLVRYPIKEYYKFYKLGVSLPIL